MGTAGVGSQSMGLTSASASASAAFLPEPPALHIARGRAGAAVSRARLVDDDRRRPGAFPRVDASLTAEAPLPSEPPAPTAAFQRGQDFIRRCVAGDPETRAEFVREYGALVRFAVAAVLRSREPGLLAEELDDLTQAVLLSFFERDCRRLKMYEGRNQASFATFVRVCATRQTLDHLRSLRRRPRITSEEERDESAESGLAGAVDPASGPEEQAATSEALDHLRVVVAELPPREQLLVRLHFVEGLDAAEIAAILGVTENAVHVLKSRVKAKLRRDVDLGADDA